MKNIYGLIIASLIASAPAMAQNEVTCEFTSITSDITTNTTLSASTLYRVENCIHVTTGVTLTIPAGTVVMFQKSSSASLVIDKGAYLLVNGTSGNEVSFVSDQQPSYRNPGDYSGLLINGKATNNFSSNAMTTDNRTCNVNAGGTDDNDSSGVVKFLRIEYAKYGLTLASVGRKTVLENIMVSYPEKSAFEFFGGTAQARRLIALNAKENDFLFNYGNRSKVQDGLGVRLSSSSNYGTAPYSNGILMANSDTNPYTETPRTHPVLDRFTLIGPAYCGATGLSSNFKNGVLFRHNTEGGIYNSVIAGWPVGVYIEDASTIANANSNPSTLRLEYSSFYNNTANTGHTPSWSSGCSATMLAWLDGTNGCSMQGNQLGTFVLGYPSSVCGNYCTTAPGFVLGGSTELTGANYDAEEVPELDNAFFVSSNFRGAFDQTTDWTANWTEFCPQSKDYCPAERRIGAPTGIKGVGADQSTALVIAPNPVNGITYAEFSTEQAGKVTVTIVNSVGQVVRTISKDAAKGKQRLAVNTEGLSAGLYIVTVEQSKGNGVHARLIVE